MDPSQFRRIDEVCDEFEAACKRGARPRPDRGAYLARVPEGDRERLLVELLRLELHYDAAASAATIDGAGSESPASERWPRVPGYEILGELGRGAMGVVYRARQLKPNRIVALKMILAGGHAGRDQLVRFLAEAEHIAQLQHPHIVQLFESGQHDDLPFFSLEYVEGGSLAEKVHDAPLAAKDAARLVESLARGMAYAHGRGIVHRDLKPHNVLLTTDGTPKITDFGLAKRIQGAPGADTAIEALTQPGAVLGTPSYMAPEQAGGDSKTVGRAADVYALGAILYRLVAGRPPFQAATPLETIRQVLDSEAPALTQVQPTTPRDLETICMKCLRKEPGQRYGTALELAEDLRHFQAGEPIHARPVGRLERGVKWVRRNPLVASLLLAVAVVLLLGTGISTHFGIEADFQRRESEKDRDRAIQSKSDADKNAREARLREAEALIEAARGTRRSRRSGQRFEALAALQKATAIGRELKQPAAWFDRIRNETIAALALPDLHITQTFNGFPAGTLSADINHDFQLYARTTSKGACSIHRVADDGLVFPLPEWGPGVGIGSHVVFGPKNLLVRFNSSRYQLWDLSPPKPVLRRLDERGSYVWGPGFRADGRLMVLCKQDGSFDVFETDTGKCRHSMAAIGINHASSVLLHPTEPVVAVCSYSSNLLLIRDLKTGAVLKSLTLPWQGQMCAWSPDGHSLAVSAGEADHIQLNSFDQATAQLQLIRTMRPSSGGSNFWFNPAGDRLVSCGYSKKLHLFDVVTGRLLFSTLPIDPGGLRFDPTGRRLAFTRVGAAKEQIGLWSVGDGREYRALFHQGTGQVAVHPNGRLAAVGRSDGVALFDLETGHELLVVRMPEGAAHGVCFDGAGNLFANRGNKVGVFRCPLHSDGKLAGRLTLGFAEQLPFPPGWGRNIATSKDGRVVALSTWGPGAWVLHPGARDARQFGTGTVYRSSVSPDGLWVAFGIHPGVVVFDVATGQRVWQHKENDFCRFSVDGRWLLFQDYNAGSGRAVEVPSWKPGPSLGPGVPFDVSSDGRMVVVGQTDGVYRLVEVATGRELARLEDPDQIVGAAVFTPDSTRLVVSADDGLRVWDLRLIRKELARRGLDWDAPPYPEAAPVATRPLELVVKGQVVNGQAVNLLPDPRLELERRLSAILTKKDTPRSLQERLELGAFCIAHKRYYSTGVRFLSEAFLIEPRLAGDLRAQHLYHAARAATLAAAGKGEDARDLNAEQRSKLRQQALDWLRADLEAYARLAKKEDRATRQAVQQRLSHWLKDADLATVRDARELTALPPQERKSWEKLWQDVARFLAMLEKTQAKVGVTDVAFFPRGRTAVSVSGDATIRLWGLPELPPWKDKP